jgi:hypothetical protein
LDKVPLENIGDFDTWRNIIWIIKDTFPDNFELVEYFSKKDPKYETYNKDENLKYMYNFWNTYVSEKSPKIGSLYHYLRKWEFQYINADINVENIKRSKIIDNDIDVIELKNFTYINKDDFIKMKNNYENQGNINNNLNINNINFDEININNINNIKTYKRYDLKEKFYWDGDFVNKWENEKILNDKINRLEEFFIDLSKVFAYIRGPPLRLFYKSNPYMPEYETDKFYEDGFKISYKGKLITLQKLLQEEKIFTQKYVKYESVNFCPYSPICKNPYPDIFNLFKEFEATLVQDFDIIKIKDIFNHILYVFANGDEYSFHWILSYFASILQNPSKKIGINYGLLGPQGCGKNIFLDWFADFIIGERYCVTMSGLDGVTKNFNSILAHKLIIFISELSSSNKFSKNSCNALKHMTTHKTIPIESKGKDVIILNNYANIIFYSNNKDSYFLDEDDRRNSIPDMNHDPEFFNENYFKELSKILTSDNANIFFSFLLNYKCIDVYDNKKIPKSKLRENIINMCMSSCDVFINKLLSSSIDYNYYESVIGCQLITPVSNGNPFIIHRNLIKLYERWCKDEGRNSIRGNVVESKITGPKFIKHGLIKWKSSQGCRPEGYLLPEKCFTKEEINAKKYIFEKYESKSSINFGPPPSNLGRTSNISLDLSSISFNLSNNSSNNSNLLLSRSSSSSSLNSIESISSDSLISSNDSLILHNHNSLTSFSDSSILHNNNLLTLSSDF